MTIDNNVYIDCLGIVCVTCQSLVVNVKVSCRLSLPLIVIVIAVACCQISLQAAVFYLQYM